MVASGLGLRGNGGFGFTEFHRVSQSFTEFHNVFYCYFDRLETSIFFFYTTGVLLWIENTGFVVLQCSARIVSNFCFYIHLMSISYSIIVLSYYNQFFSICF